MYLSEGDATIVWPHGFHLQVYGTVEGVNPWARIRNCSSDHFEIPEVETARVTSGGVGRIREGFHPRFEDGSAREELDTVDRVRVRRIHDLETREHALSVVGSSCRWSMIRSSGGWDPMVSIASLIAFLRSRATTRGMHHSPSHRVELLTTTRDKSQG